MGKGSGGGTQNVKTTYQPPAYLLPTISSYLSAINKLAGEPYPFPDYQVAPFTSLENQGLAQAGQAAQQAAGLNTNAINEANATLQGKYLIPPQQVQDAINRQTMQEYRQSAAPSEMSQAALAGAFGGSADAEQRALNQFNLTTALADPAYQLYEQERQNQVGTAADAAKISLGATIPSQELLQAGGLQQAQNQSQLDALYQNLYNKAQFPFEQAGLLGTAIGTAGGNSGVVTQNAPGQGFGSSFFPAAGLGLAGAGIGNMLGLGAAGSGLLGGGLGVLGLLAGLL